jgi:hypothetical protein
VRVPGVSKTKFRKALVAASGGCTIQHNGWPCGSDFPFGQRDWTAVLAYRGDYDKDYRVEKEDGSVVYRMVTDIKFHPDGSFSHHVFEEFPEEKLKERIVKMVKQLGVGK